MDDATERLWLADWKRRIAELYAAVRSTAAADPATAWDAWRAEREALYRGHPQSPVRATDRAAFRGRHWPYDDRLRFEVRLEAQSSAPATPARWPATLPVALPSSGGDDLAFDRVGVVRLALKDADGSLTLFWMHGYAGGLFLPLGDATNGAETYGAGRYLLDTAKGADLGGNAAAGTLVVDLNFAFQPSCAFDPHWTCPLSPPENRLTQRVEAGERLR